LKYQNRSEDTYRFENGWFITRRQIESNYKKIDPNYNKIVVSSFQHDEVEVPVQIEYGKVNFQQVFIERTPKTKLATLKGIVLNEKGQPVPNAQVRHCKTIIRSKLALRCDVLFSIIPQWIRIS
jgi:hypothetical protein